MTLGEWIKHANLMKVRYFMFNLYDDHNKIVIKAGTSVAYALSLYQSVELSDTVAIKKSVPTWRSLRDNKLHEIKYMNDQHLLNSVAVCLRADNRYQFNAERMQSFYFMIREVARRRLHKKLQEKING